MLSVITAQDPTLSMFEPRQSRFPPVIMSSARFYLPSTAAVPVFPYMHHFTASSYVSPEMYSHKDRVLSAYMSQCHHPAYQGISYHSTEQEKPAQSYIGLIGKAILSSPQQKLVLGDIYNYILTHYPYFRNKGPGWRNSVRHNLSLNDCFVKVGRSPSGKGHFWAINPINYDDFSRGDYKRKRTSRRNRESSAAEGGSKGKTSRKGEELKTTKEVSKFTPSEISGNGVSSTNGAEKRGFHIETLLSNKLQQVKTSETQRKKNINRCVPEIVITQKLNEDS